MALWGRLGEGPDPRINLSWQVKDKAGLGNIGGTKQNLARCTRTPTAVVLSHQHATGGIAALIFHTGFVVLSHRIRSFISETDDRKVEMEGASDLRKQPLNLSLNV